MSSLRGVVQAVVAVVYVALIAGGLRLHGAVQAEARRVDSVAQARLLVLVLAAVGLLVAVFTLWAARHAVAAAVATVLLTVVLAVQGPFRVFALPRWVSDAWMALGFGGGGIVVPLAWGAAVVALVAAVAGRGRGRHGRRPV